MNEQLKTSTTDNDTNESLQEIKLNQLSWIHWLIVIFSLVITFFAWYISNSQVKANIENRFKRESEQVIELVKERMELYENALLSGVALIDSKQGEISYLQWKSYAQSLQIENLYPGINGIGVIFNISPDDRDSFLNEQRISQKSFNIHPQHQQSELWPITYIVPEKFNYKAIGLDMAFETNRYTAIKKARDSGKAQVTGPITLVQDSKKTPGFLFYTPFYKNAGKPSNMQQRQALIKGVVYAPFIMQNLMQGTLAQKSRQVSLKIYDDNEILYNDDLEGNIQQKQTDFTTIQTVSMYGRQWVFHISANLDFKKAVNNNQPLFILIGGLIIDSLLLMLFIFLSNANRKATSLAQKMTKDLREKTERLESSNHDLEQFTHVASHDLKSPLNAIIKISTWLEEDCGDVIPETSKEYLELLKSRSERMKNLLDALLDYSNTGKTNYPFKKVNLQRVVNDIFEFLDRPKAFTVSANSIDLYLPIVPLEIILRNLISNSIKHHDKESGHIRVEGTIHDKHYQINVVDDGPGIPPNLHDKAFEVFQTLKSRDKVEGSGIGLSLVKRLLSHYKGSIEMISDGHRGMTLVIIWPRKHKK